MKLLCWLGLHDWWVRRAFTAAGVTTTHRACSKCLKRQRWAAYSNRTEGWENES